MISFIAHEFHHYYKNQYFPYAQDQNFIWVIDQIQGEGIADQINKGKWFHDKNLYPKYAEKNKNYLEWYKNSPEIIRKMGRLFEASYGHPEKKDGLWTKTSSHRPDEWPPDRFLHLLRTFRMISDTLD